LPIEKLIVASNSNDILTRLFETGHMSISQVIPTLSPSMDIQVSSNFERLLYEICKRDGETVTKILEQFRSKGSVYLGKGRWKAICRNFVGYRVNDDTIKKTISQVYQDSGELLDPHTAVGFTAGEKFLDQQDSLVITLATAHPAKFPDAIELATGTRPALPTHLSDLYLRKEIYSNLPNDLNKIRNFISSKLSHEAAA